MIHCKELNKDFENQKDLFKALKAEKKTIIDAKKSQVMKSCDKGLAVKTFPLDATKLNDTVKGLSLDDNYYYIAVNTTKVMDSHGDVHLDGIWDETIKQRKGKNYLVADHTLELDKVIARKEYVEMMIVDVPFSVVGKSYSGNTQALVYKVAKDKIISTTAKEWLDSGDDIEASVRMQYVNIVLAMDSNDEDDATEKAAFDKYSTQIANKEEFGDINYFWAVKEAKNLFESSLVLFGSNDATGKLEQKQEPTPVTPVVEPSFDTLKAIDIITNFTSKN